MENALMQQPSHINDNKAETTLVPTEADDPGALVPRAVVRVAVRAVVQLSLRALALHLQSTHS